MSKHAKTWWGQRFIEALEDFTDSGRLQRGRSYSSDNRIKQWLLNDGKVEAKLRGNINPYFGVYKEPTYKVSVQMTHLSAAQWQKVIQKLSQRASFIARLLLNEIPENIENVFADLGVHFLPNDYRDFKVACDFPRRAGPTRDGGGADRAGDSTIRLTLRARPSDPSVVHTDLAEALVLAGRPGEAKRQMIAALEIAPRYERAQDLLLRLVDGGSMHAVPR